MASNIPARPDLSRLKSVLLTSGLQIKDNATYQVINSLIDLATQGFSIPVTLSTIGGGGGITGILPIANGGTGTGSIFTEGSVVFAGPSGIYSEDNSNFFWDNTNKRLGILQSGPGASLDINLNFPNSTKHILNVGDFPTFTFPWGNPPRFAVNLGGKNFNDPIDSVDSHPFYVEVISPTFIQDNTESSPYAGPIIGQVIEMKVQGSGNLAVIQGNLIGPVYDGTGFISDGLYALNAQPVLSNGTLINLVGYSTFLQQDGGVITNSIGIHIFDIQKTAGALDNDYGIYIDNINQGSRLNCAILTNSGIVQFGDNVIPGINNSIDFGNISNLWRTGYFGTSLFSPLLNGSSAANGDLVLQATTNGTQTTSFITMQNLAGVVIIPGLDSQSTLLVKRAAGLNVISLGTYPGFAAFGGFWAGPVTPSGINYAFISDGTTETTFNAPATTAVMYFRIGHTNTPSGLTLTANGFGIRNDTPSARLHIAAGAIGAGNAPIKLTSGALLTTAEAGAIEFLTDKFYGTITTGAARKTFAFLESPVFTTPNIGAASGASLSLSNTVNLISTGAASTSGTATFVAGTVTVNTTAATATAIIVVQRKTSGGTPGTREDITKVAGTSFTVTSDNAADTSTFDWFIVETH